MKQGETRSRPNPRGKVRINLYDVPEEWYEFLRAESERLGVSISDYVKMYIMKPWFNGRAQGASTRWEQVGR